MLKNLFGGKKKEFFIELDESKASPSEIKTAPVTPVKTETVAEKPKAETPKTDSNKTSVKAKATKKKAVSEPAPVVVASKPAKVEPTEVKFATQSFPSSLSRRNPGPSLNKFKEMARQSKAVR